MMDIKGGFLLWFTNFMIKRRASSGVINRQSKFKGRMKITRNQLKNYTNQLFEN